MITCVTCIRHKKTRFRHFCAHIRSFDSTLEYIYIYNFSIIASHHSAELIEPYKIKNKTHSN